MIELIQNQWKEMTDDNKLLVKQIGVAAITLYVALQLISLLLPIAITLISGHWIYKSLAKKNPKIMR